MQGTEQSENTNTSQQVIKERKRWLLFGLPFTFTTYSLSSKSLTLRKGLLTTTEDDLLLFRVMDVSLRRTLMQKLFGLGSMTINSSDKTSPMLEIKNIKNFRIFKDTLDERVEKERLRMRFKTGELMGGGDFDNDDGDSELS
jgi:uncharacterized membrane protein YdbT with pleckstrin-like domain